jgi:hypothetical protein
MIPPLAYGGDSLGLWFNNHEEHDKKKTQSIHGVKIAFSGLSRSEKV